MKIVKIGDKYALMILIHYRIGREVHEEWYTKATGPKEFCERAMNLIMEGKRHESVY